MVITRLLPDITPLGAGETTAGGVLTSSFRHDTNGGRRAELEIFLFRRKLPGKVGLTDESALSDRLLFHHHTAANTASPIVAKAPRVRPTAKPRTDKLAPLVVPWLPPVRDRTASPPKPLVELLRTVADGDVVTVAKSRIPVVDALLAVSD